MRTHILVWLVLLMSAVGCSLAPQYTRPEMPVPGAWPQGEAYKDMSSSDAVSPHELMWDAFYKEANLQRVIDMALQNNRDLRLAALNVERARALYGVQRAERYPALSGSGAFTKQRRSADLINPAEPRTVEQYNLGMGIASWELDFFGRIRSLEDQALEDYLATEEAHRGARIALLAEVGRVYYTLAADLENVKLSRSTLDTQQAAYQLIKRQYEVGVASELDLRQAQTQVDAARGDVARFTQLAAQDRNALDLLAGASVPASLLPEGLNRLGPLGKIFPGLPSETLLNRPDIIAAEHRLKGANAFIGAARAAFFPRISLTTAVGTASDELSGLFGSGTTTWNFTPQIGAPIFDARTWAAYRVSQAQREIAVAQYEKTIQTAFREVADALAVSGTVDEQLAAQESLTQAVAETYRLAHQRYDKGIDSYLGVLDAQRSLYSAQQGLIFLRLAKIANQVRLYGVLGGGGD